MEAWKAQLKGVARSFALLVRVMSPIRALMAAGLALLVLGTFSQLAQPAITGLFTVAVGSEGFGGLSGG